MADNRIHVPQSSGGLVRYFEDYKSKIEINPYIVVGFIVLVVIFEIILHILR